MGSNTNGCFHNVLEQWMVHTYRLSHHASAQLITEGLALNHTAGNSGPPGPFYRRVCGVAWPST